MTAKAMTKRCAIYTRKSSEEGLEQDLNSLDAQREACEAYIKSQVAEGWRPLEARYDDGGVSGGTLDRPALTQLLADIRAGRIDTVVVYKVDRLTRSLADFAKIVEVFDAEGVAFVSVTQQFNTTTSMGRLTLNMLLSFAQFEREVTGERIRDKIAASKKKGLWMGGNVPLGYEPDGRSLAINEAEAATVRKIYALYLEHRNVRQVQQETERQSLTTKLRTSADGTVIGGGKTMSRGYIYKLLGNPLYAGQIAHKGETYEGQHPAIVDPETWKAVQAALADNTPARSTRKGSTSPLMGKLYDETGTTLTPTHAVKAGRRYRYYVSRHLVTGTAKEAEAQQRGGWRLPAREIEKLVAGAVNTLLADRSVLVQAAREADIAADEIQALLGAVSRWSGEPLTLVERIDLQRDQTVIAFTTAPIEEAPAAALRLVIPTRLRRRGVEMRLVLDGPNNSASSANPDPALIKAVVRAHGWLEDLITGRAQSIKAIARAEDCSDRYVARVLILAFLAPDIVEAILAGTQPVDLTAEKLTKDTDLPLNWREQAVLLQFDCRLVKQNK